VPFYVTVETHGTEGQVLNVEDKVKEVKEDIVVALGLSRFLVTGDGPNFATASVSLQKMLVMIREINRPPATTSPWSSTTGWSSRATRTRCSSSSSTTSTLSGEALKAKLKQHKIGLLRSKDELVKLLAEKQASLKQAQQLAEQLKKVPAPGGLQDLTVAELTDLPAAQAIARRKQVGPLKNKQQLIKALQKAASDELAEKAKQRRRKFD